MCVGLAGEGGLDGLAGCVGVPGLEASRPSWAWLEQGGTCGGESWGLSVVLWAEGPREAMQVLWAGLLMVLVPGRGRHRVLGVKMAIVSLRGLVVLGMA